MTIVDAYNVLGARPDGWWHDRPAALAGLVRDIGRWRARAAGEPERVLVVVDGWPDEAVPEGVQEGVEVRYAQRPGPDAADRVIADLVRSHDAPADLTIVTSDAALRRTVTGHGAAVVGAGTFRRRLET